MTQAAENDDGIVWPDEEHLFAADVSSDDRAASQSSEAEKFSDGGANHVGARNDTSFAATATETTDANEFWDHDDRSQQHSNLRSVSPMKYPLTEEEADIWSHDKFDLLKIGPPPGLSGNHKKSSAKQGLHQRHQSSRRTRPGGPPARTYRVLEVPRPPNTGQMPPGGWPEAHYGSYTYPTFSIDDLKEDSKTAWPQESEVRDEDISKWGWDDQAEAGSSDNASAAAEEPASSPPASTSQRNMPRPGRSKRDGPKEPRAPRLSQLQQQTLRQVDQRNADLAAVMTRLRLQELRQQSGQISQGAAFQQPYGRPPPAVQGPLGYPIQDQLPGPPVQYQFSNGVLVPSYAVPMQPGPALPSSPSSMRPPISHMFNQFSQQARPTALSGPPPPTYAANPLAQAAPSRPMDRGGAGYMASSKKAHQGHLKGAQSIMRGMSAATPSPMNAMPFSQVPISLQPPAPAMGAGAPRLGSQGLVIGDPTHQAVAAAAAWASGTVKGVPTAAQKPGKRALAIVDPESKQTLPVPGSAASGAQLTRTDSSSSSNQADKPGKKLMSIVDPTNKQPVQVPSKPVGPSRLIRANSSTSAVSSDSGLPAKRGIPIVDPLNKQPVAIGSAQAQKQAAPASVQGPQPAMSKRAKGPIAIVDPVTASEVQLPAVDVSTRKTGFASTPGQSQRIMMRARKPLAIVDPKPKALPVSAVSSTAEGHAALRQSAAPSLAGASVADTVKLALHVADDSCVKCGLHVRGPQHPGSRSQVDHATKVQLVVTAEDQVACSIVSSQPAEEHAGSQQTWLTCSASQ